MIVDPQLPRALWPVCRIISIMPGTDGQVKVRDRQYMRPVAQLIQLPVTEDNERKAARPSLIDEFGGPNSGRLLRRLAVYTCYSTPSLLLDSMP